MRIRNELRRLERVGAGLNLDVPKAMSPTVPPQNLVKYAIVDVSTLGVKLADAHASVAVCPARDRQIEPEAAARTRS